MADKAEKLFTYKGKPLVRSGNTLYYGDLNDPYVVMMTITDSKPFEDLNMASKITVQLMLTDPEVPRQGPLSEAQREGWAVGRARYRRHLAAARVERGPGQITPYNSTRERDPRIPLPFFMRCHSSASPSVSR